jgi:hypothetical protein
MAWNDLRPAARIGVVALGVAFAALVAVFALSWAPEWLAQDNLTGTDKAEDVGRSRTAVLATLAGLIAIVGAMFTGLSYRLNRAGQITERFTRAIDQLGSDKVEIRLGGIYALERIARDSYHDHPQVVEVLTAYVRERAPWPPVGGDGADRASGVHGLAVGRTAIEALERMVGDLAPHPHNDHPSGSDNHGTDNTSDRAEALEPTPETDVQAALSVLGRRDRTQDTPPPFRLNLSATNLRGVSLAQAHLERARLAQAHLENASTLAGAHLEEADLYEAHLEGATLYEAHMEGAFLIGAHLQGANLQRVHLEGALLRRAHLKEADLSDAVYDDRTVWPDGSTARSTRFDVRGSGAVHIDELRARGET